MLPQPPSPTAAVRPARARDVPYDGRVSLRLPAGLIASLARGHARGTGLPVLAAIATAVVALDQLTKAGVRAWLREGERWPADAELIRITHVENSGAAFGILQGASGILLLSSAVAAILIVAYLWSAPRDEPLSGIALAVVLGGTAGNLIDRALRGTVTDFIDPTHYPAFNVADSAIVVGVAALVVLSLFGSRRAPSSTDEDDGVAEST